MWDVNLFMIASVAVAMLASFLLGMRCEMRGPSGIQQDLQNLKSEFETWKTKVESGVASVKAA